ncbi:MAG: PilZ domain-containing protein [Acidobacteria bacterium]|nr:PilZ domain-containing protein [Acidobacteriota bacterium]
MQTGGHHCRREHHRLPVELHVRLDLLHMDLSGRTLNISEQGARVRLPERTALKRGDEVLLDLSLPDGGPLLKVLCWVAAVDHHHPGEALSLTFFALPEAEALRIRSLVAKGPTA